MKKTLTLIKSPITGGRVFEVEDVEVKEFRKEKFEVHVRYFLCEDSGEQFTDESQDELFTNELYSSWRVKHGVPFPDEIKAIREKYGLNYTQMSRILGFGINQWRQYEAGMVPSESQGKMIKAVGQKPFMLDLLESSRCAFDGKEFENIRSLIESCSDSPVDRYLQVVMYGRDNRLSIENGYGSQNPGKLSEMVQYIVSQCDGICPTKLNKLMFYSDFSNYRKSGRSISGLKYRAIQYGPVPEHYDTIYDHIDNLDKHIKVHPDGGETSSFSVSGNVKMKFLTMEERKVLDEVLQRIGKKQTKEIVEMSHMESAWLENEVHHDFIPYSYAFDLKDM